MKLTAFLLVLLALAATPFAQDPQEQAAAREKAQKLASGLNYQPGEITPKGGLAKIRVPEEFRSLDSKRRGHSALAVVGKSARLARASENQPGEPGGVGGDHHV